MDTEMMYMPIEADLRISWYGKEWTIPSVDLVDFEGPYGIRKWIEMEIIRFFDLTDKEAEHKVKNLTRTYEFEVEIEHNGTRAVSATCQTECPNFVKAWIEKEAMKKFDLEGSQVMS